MTAEDAQTIVPLNTRPEAALDSNAIFSLLRDAIREHRGVRITIKGESMVPGVLPGMKAYLEGGDARTFRKGMLAVYRGDNMLVIHRILKVESTPRDCIVLLRGDRNAGEPDPVRKEDILGVVTGIGFHDDHLVSTDSVLWKIWDRLMFCCARMSYRVLPRTVRAVLWRALRPVMRCLLKSFC